MINAKFILKLLESILVNEQAEEIKRRDGYGFILEIYTSEHNPPHVHIKYTNDEYVCKLYISPFIPEDYDDLIPYKDRITNDLKKKIIKWANGEDSDGDNNWYSLILDWFAIFKEFNTSEYERIRGVIKPSTVYPSNDTKSVSDLTTLKFKSLYIQSISCYVFVAQSVPDEDPQIQFSKKDNQKITLTLDLNTGKQIATNSKISNKEYNNIKKWYTYYKECLLDYWNRNISLEELKQILKIN